MLQHLLLLLLLLLADASAAAFAAAAFWICFVFAVEEPHLKDEIREAGGIEVLVKLLGSKVCHFAATLLSLFCRCSSKAKTTECNIIISRMILYD